MVKALGFVVGHPAGFFLSENDVPGNFRHVFVFFGMFLVNIWPSSCELRTSKLILVSRGAYCDRAYYLIECLSIMFEAISSGQQ